MSKSRELYTTTELVRELLTNEPKTRNSDNYLYLRVLQTVGRKKGIDINNMSVVRFFHCLNNYGFPAFETVRRTRQKLQEHNAELAGSEEVEAQRALNEETFIEFVRSVW